ncbi:MAG: XRE family transcriptional regulator [Parasporobacterium sp.]|nr:XRE family transcriptional regulator [Parasporobacterium sp.]
MSYTKFGEFMRVLRVKNHEIMGDTAKLLNCMVSFVSSVENGKKNVPESWAPILIDHYHLDESQQKELYEAIEESKTQVKLNLSSASVSQRKLAVQFQRSFEKLDDETANAILNLLKEDAD